MRPRWGRIVGTLVVVLGGVALATGPSPAPKRTKSSNLRQLGIAQWANDHPEVRLEPEGVVHRGGRDVDPALEWVVLCDGGERCRLQASERMFIDFRRHAGPGAYTVYLARNGWPVSNVLTWKQ